MSFIDGFVSELVKLAQPNNMSGTLDRYTANLLMAKMPFRSTPYLPGAITRAAKEQLMKSAESNLLSTKRLPQTPPRGSVLTGLIHQSKFDIRNKPHSPHIGL